MKIARWQPYADGLEPGAKHRVRSSLSRTSRGSPKDFVTPLVEDRDNPSQGRLSRLVELLPQVRSEYPWLNELEQAQAEKIGPFSIMVPYSERKEQVHSYFALHPVSVDEKALVHARTRLRERLRMSNLTPTSLYTAFKNMPKGTNLGGPFFSASSDYYTEMFEMARNLERGGWDVGVIPDPAMLYWRGQPKGLSEIPKQRTVWGFPHYLTVAELSVQTVMLNKLKDSIEFAAWNGPGRVNAVISWMFNNTRGQILSVDFSGFDASVPALLIDEVFDYIEESFRDEYVPLISFLRRNFLEVGLLTPEGIISGRDGAIPSGSGLTNMIGGLVQLFAFEYIAYRMGVNVVTHTVQGDDGVIVFDDTWDLSEVVGYAAEIGLKVSDDKGTVSDREVHFLQNVHHKDYTVAGVNVGVRPIMRVLNGMLSYERMANDQWSGYDDTLRWWQQSENAKFHPRIRQLAMFLYKHDKYSRTLNANDVLQRAGGIEKAESVLKQPSFPYGKTSLRSLDQFTIVRLLAELRNGVNSEKGVSLKI